MPDISAVLTRKRVELSRARGRSARVRRHMVVLVERDRETSAPRHGGVPGYREPGTPSGPSDRAAAVSCSFASSANSGSASSAGRKQSSR